MGLARKIIGWGSFIVSTAFNVAKGTIDWVGRATFPEDVANLRREANPMIDWLGQQPDLLFYSANLLLSLVGLGIIFSDQIKGWLSKISTRTNDPKPSDPAKRDAAQEKDMSSADIKYTQIPSSTYNITSNFQSGGITAHTINLQTKRHRTLSDTRGEEIKERLLKFLPKHKEIEVSGLIGDAESMLYANEIRTFLKDSGYTIAKNGMLGVSMIIPPKDIAFYDGGIGFPNEGKIENRISVIIGLNPD